MFIREATLADAASIARVHTDSWWSAYREIFPGEFLAGVTYEQAEARWTRILNPSSPTGFTYVVEDEREGIVGFANGGAERAGDAVYSGELYAIYLLAAHQRKGLGRRLALAVVERLRRMNFDSMLVWVLADAEARYFYEALGGKKVSEQDITRGGATLKMFSYGWRDMRALAERLK